MTTVEFEIRSPSRRVFLQFDPWGHGEREIPAMIRVVGRVLDHQCESKGFKNDAGEWVFDTRPLAEILKTADTHEGLFAVLYNDDIYWLSRNSLVQWR